MRFIDTSTFTADRPWGALDLGELDTATIKLHWTNEPYTRHVNDDERIERLTPGTVCCVNIGDAHVAHPDAEARILVVERKGSV